VGIVRGDEPSHDGNIGSLSFGDDVRSSRGDTEPNESSEVEDWDFCSSRSDSKDCDELSDRSDNAAVKVVVGLPFHL